MELAQIDMIYSLLSMLNTDDKEHISRTLLGMSTCRDSCIAMRQAGCMSLLVQLIHGCPDNSSRNAPSNNASSSNNNSLSANSSRVARQRAAAALHNLVHCLPDEKWRRREARVLRLLEIVREFSDNQQQRILAANNAAAAGSQPPALVDSSRVGPAVAALMKLSFDEDHRHAITVLGGLQAVSELLVVDLEMFPIVPSARPSPLSVNIRRFGCMTLTNLTFGDVTNKSLLCSMPTTLKAVVFLLGFFENEDIVQAAGSVLRNLSWSADPPSKAALRDAGAVKQLVRSVMAVKRESTRTAVFSALWNVSAHLSENKADICCAEGALDFIAFAMTLPGSIGESAGGVLRNISSHIAVNNEYRQVLRRRGCFEVLVNQLKSSNLTTVSNACGALWNLSAKCPEDQQTLWELGAVHHLQALTTSKHHMIATAASAAIRNLEAYKQQFQAAASGGSIDQQHFIKQSLNKTTSESNDASTTPLSSSFPGPGRQQPQQQQQQHASSSYSSPFAATEKPQSSSSSVKPQNAAAVLGLLGASCPVDQKGTTPGGSKNSILYSDTPNSNVVHLNYLHMLATRSQPQQQQQFPPPPPPPPNIQGSGKSVTDGANNNNNSVRSSPQTSIVQRSATTRLPSGAGVIVASSPVVSGTNRAVCLPPGTSPSPFSAKTNDLNDNNDEEDEQPTNFGQRFQETEIQEHQQRLDPPQKMQQFMYPSGTATSSAVAGSVKSSTSPTGSSESSRSHNNENKLMAAPLAMQKINPIGPSAGSALNKMAMAVKQQQQQQQQPPTHVTFSSAVETVEQTPMMFSRRSSVDSLNSVDVPSIRSEVVSDYSRLASGAISPTDLPESPGAIAEEQHRQQQQTAFRMPAPTGASAFTTPQQIAKPRLLPSFSAPLAAAEESFPAVDSYADEAERPIIYATEDTPAVLSHATSLSNLTTPGFETPGGTFSPVRAIGTDRPVSPPTAAGMRLFFRKPVEPEPVEDEVFPYYTEDTPCHLSASSSLSSLSVMSHTSSRRSATTTPLRQKVFALQSGTIGSIPAGTFAAPGTGGASLHPRVVAAASRNADPFMRHSPFTAQPIGGIGYSPFVVASPQTRPRPNAVLLEESEDSHNISGLSNDQVEAGGEDDDAPRILNESDHEEGDKNAHHNEVGNNSEDEDNGGLQKPHHEHDGIESVDRLSEHGNEDESETEDLIQQLIDTALESPNKQENARPNQSPETALEQPKPIPDQTRTAEVPIIYAPAPVGASLNEVEVEEESSMQDNELRGDLDVEPTAKELEMVEECINFVLTPDAPSQTKPHEANQHAQPAAPSVVHPPASDSVSMLPTDSTAPPSPPAPPPQLTTIVVPTIVSQQKLPKRNSLTVVSGALKVRSPQKAQLGDCASGEQQHLFIKGTTTSHRRKSAAKLSSTETSPIAAADAGRSISPGSASRGGSSSGGGSTAKQIASKKLQQSGATVAAANKRSPTAAPATKKTSASQPRRSRSRGEEHQCLMSPTSAGASCASGGPSSASKISPSSSSTASSHNTGSAVNKQSASSAFGTAASSGSKRWNFSTRPNLLTAAPTSDPSQAGKSCCRHQVDRQQQQPTAPEQAPSSTTVWQRPQPIQPARKVTSSTTGENSNPIGAPSGEGSDVPAASTTTTTTTTTTSGNGKPTRRVLMTTV